MVVARIVGLSLETDKTDSEGRESMRREQRV